MPPPLLRLLYRCIFASSLLCLRPCAAPYTGIQKARCSALKHPSCLEDPPAVVKMIPRYCPLSAGHPRQDVFVMAVPPLPTPFLPSLVTP